jgi:MBOAT membrane-bound O-acyltransferase family protein
MSFQSVYAMPLLSSHSEQLQFFHIGEPRTNYHLQFCRQTILRRLGMSLRVATTHFLKPSSLVRTYFPLFSGPPAFIIGHIRWNSTSWDEFSRKWNKPVHVFLLRHVYAATIMRYRVSRTTAMLLTFLLSACVHELVMVVVTRKFR